MPDPTEIVILSGLSATVALFSVVAITRTLTNRRKPEGSAPPANPSAEDRPFISPSVPSAPPALPPPWQTVKVPVWFYHPLDLLGALFVLLVFGGMAIASIHTPKNFTAPLNPMVLAINIAFQFILAGMITGFIFWRVKITTWLGLRWSGWMWALLIAPCTVIFMWLLFAALQATGYIKWMESLGVETVQDTVKLLHDSNDPLVIGLMAFAAIFTAPICEEIIFRGYFYPVMKRFSGRWVAAICSAFVFSAAHGNLTALLPLFVFGLVLVLIYEKTGSLWAPISVHFCFNGATVILQLAAKYFNLPLDTSP